MTKPDTTPEPLPSPPSNFASRRAAREAAEAAGEGPAKWQSPTLRAGVDAENPTLDVTHVRG
jgi:hypothetical protein